VISSSQKPLSDNTQHLQETDIQATTHPALQSVSMSFIAGNLSVLSGGR